MSKGRSISVPCGPCPIPPVNDCQSLNFLSERPDLQKCRRVASGTWPSLSEGLGYWLQAAPLLALNQAVGSFLDFWPNAHSIFQPHWNQSKYKASLAFSLNWLAQLTQAQKKPGDVNECLIWLWLTHPVTQPQWLICPGSSAGETSEELLSIHWLLRHLCLLVINLPPMYQTTLNPPATPLLPPSLFEHFVIFTAFASATALQDGFPPGKW